MKKILFKKILFVFGLLLIFLLITAPALAEVDANERWSDGNFEYKIQRDGNNISLTSTKPKIPRAAGIPNLVGTITGTTFTGKVYLVADECPNLDGYVSAKGTVSADGSSITVTYNTSDFYYRTCVEKAGSESEVTKTYSVTNTVNTSPTPFSRIQPTQPENTPLDYGISDILGFNRELLQLEKTQKIIDQCPPPRVPSESTCVSDALSGFELPTYLKDVTIEPDFTNVIVLDSSKMQVISFPDGIKSVPDYMVNTISANLDHLKDEITMDTSQNFPSLNLAPAYQTKVRIPDQSYSIVESSGLSSVTTLSKAEPNRLGYSGHWESLVSLDKDIDNATVVGGPAILNATKMVLDSNAKLTLLDNSNQSVMEVSNGAKIVVAGWADADTVEATMDFVSQLKNLDDE